MLYADLWNQEVLETHYLNEQLEEALKALEDQISEKQKVPWTTAHSLMSLTPHSGPRCTRGVACLTDR